MWKTFSLHRHFKRQAFGSCQFMLYAFARVCNQSCGCVLIPHFSQSFVAAGAILRNKAGKFLKKLFAASDRGDWILQDNLVLSTGLIIWIDHRELRDSEADVSLTDSNVINSIDKTKLSQYYGFLLCLVALRTFALIASAHHYCARKFTVIGQMAIDIALLEFNDFGRSVTPTFLFRNRFYLQLSSHCPKMNKKSMWEVKKISRFLSTGQEILPSCGCKARETIVAKCELFLWGTSPVDEIRLIGPLKPYLAETISLQSSNCNILGLAATVAFFSNEARFTQIWVFFRECSLLNEVGDPHFFLHFWHH